MLSCVAFDKNEKTKKTKKKRTFVQTNNFSKIFTGVFLKMVFFEMVENLIVKLSTSNIERKFMKHTFSAESLNLLL